MDSVKFRTTQKTLGTICQGKGVKDKPILQDIFLHIFLINVSLYWIMGIKGNEGSMPYFSKAIVLESQIILKCLCHENKNKDQKD